MKVRGKPFWHAFAILMFLQVEVLGQLHNQRFVSSKVSRYLDR